MDREVLDGWLQEAIARLIVDQWDLAVLGVGERTVTSYLASYLAELSEIPADMRVDHEYNRHLDAVKRIAWRVREEGEDSEGERRIYPDLVIHRRGTDDDNWLVIEAKRGEACDRLDRLKIEALIEEYGYRWGVMLAFGMGNNGWHPSAQWVSSEGQEGRADLYGHERLGELNAIGLERWTERSHS